MRKATWAALGTMLIVALLALCVGTSQCGKHVCGSSKIIRAKGEAYNIFLYLLSYRAEQPAVGTGSVDEAYPEKVLRFYYESDELPNVSASTNTWTWIDPWGMTYNVQVRGVTMRTNAFNAAFGNSDDVVVWSSGVNKKNEYGQGDDIRDFNFDRSHRHSGGCHGRN